MSALPPIDQSTLPLDIQKGSQARRDAYTAGLGFEQMLVQQLTDSVTEDSQDAMGGDSPYASLLPQALTDGIMNAGGLGLARQLTDAMAPLASVAPAGTAPTASTDGGASAPTAPTTTGTEETAK
ncbi:MAG TPA: hypothetical protein VGM91_18770 [Conexibacter sp.]|jgi:Rod binding domain-containing protein